MAVVVVLATPALLVKPIIMINNIYAVCFKKHTAFFIEPATITGIIQRMENSNLLIREYRNGNKKTNYVSLTEKGFETAKKVQEIFKKAEKEAFKDISQEDLLSFMTTLKKINNNIITKEYSKNE